MDDVKGCRQISGQPLFRHVTEMIEKVYGHHHPDCLIPCVQQWRESNGDPDRIEPVTSASEASTLSN